MKKKQGYPKGWASHANDLIARYSWFSVDDVLRGLPKMTAGAERTVRGKVQGYLEDRHGVGQVLRDERGGDVYYCGRRS
jgi:hypothetical protein